MQLNPNLLPAYVDRRNAYLITGNRSKANGDFATLARIREMLGIEFNPFEHGGGLNKLAEYGNPALPAQGSKCFSSENKK
jgi:hypothetical protein